MNEKLLKKSIFVRSVGRMRRIVLASAFALLLPSSLALAQRAEPISLNARSTNRTTVQASKAARALVPTRAEWSADVLTPQHTHTARSIILGGAFGGVMGAIVGHQVVRYADVSCPNASIYPCNVPRTKLTLNGVVYGAFLGGVAGAVISRLR